MKLEILYGYYIFSAISFRVIDAWYSEFSIIGLLYIAQDFMVFFIFGVLAYYQSNVKCTVQWEFYCRAELTVSIIRHCSKIYTAGSAEDVYILTIDQST